MVTTERESAEVARLVQTLEVGDRAVARLGWAVANTDWRADLRSLTTRLSRLEEALERAKPVVKYAANMPDSDDMPEWAKELRHRARTALDSETKER